MKWSGEDTWCDKSINTSWQSGVCVTEECFDDIALPLHLLVCRSLGARESACVSRFCQTCSHGMTSYLPKDYPPHTPLPPSLPNKMIMGTEMRTNLISLLSVVQSIFHVIFTQISYVHRWARSGQLRMRLALYTWRRRRREGPLNESSSAVL